MGARGTDGRDGRARWTPPRRSRRASNRRLAPLAAARERTPRWFAAADGAGRGQRRAGDGRIAPGGRGVPGDGARVPAAARRATTRPIWAAVARRLGELDAPYDVALGPLAPGRGDASARRADRAGRAQAQAPLLDAVELGTAARRVPLLRELRELAGRARITLPAEVDELLARRRARAPDGADACHGQPPAARRGDAADQRERASDLVRGDRGRPADAAPKHRHLRAERPRARGPRAWSPRAGPTARSGSACSSARRPSASTSGTSWPSSRCPAGSRPPRSPSGWASPTAADATRSTGRLQDPDTARPGGRSPGLDRGSRNTSSGDEGPTGR